MSPKSALRASVRTRLHTIPTMERQQRSREIAQQIAALSSWRDATWVGSFSALPDEPDLSSLFALREHQQICLPKITGETLVFLEVCTSDDLEVGRWGLLEPIYRESAIVAPAQIDLLFVPGVAFTHEGYRMGRGRGYYDRYLAQAAFHAATVGVCFREQLVETLPLEEHDLPVGAVIAG